MRTEQQSTSQHTRPRRARLLARGMCWGLAALMALTLVARAFSGLAWPIDMVATFAAQEAAACVLLALLALVLRARWAALALLLIGVTHWVWLAGGRAPHARADVDEARIVRVLTFNYLGANAQTTPFIDVLAHSDVDVAVVLEAPDALIDAVRDSAELRARFPYQSLPQRGQWWNRIKLSRWPMEEPNLINYKNAGEKFNYVAGRSAIVAHPGGRFVLTAMLPISPRSASDWAVGNRTIRRSGAILRERLTPMGLPVVVCVDMNGSPSGYRTRLVRRVTGLRRSKPLLVPCGTWPSALPPLLRVAIDDVLVSRGVAVRSWRTIEGAFGSDHVPVEVELVLPAPAESHDDPTPE